MDPTFAAFLALLNGVPVLGPVLPYVPLICGLCVLIDAFVPPPPEGSKWVPLRNVVHVMAGNFGFARNAVPAGSVPASVAAHAAEAKAAAETAKMAAATLAEAIRRQPEAVPSPGAGA